MSSNVSHSPDLEKRVRQHDESGPDNSASEIITEASGPLGALQDVQAESLVALSSEIAQGVAEIKAGRIREVSMADIQQRGRAILASRKTA